MTHLPHSHTLPDELCDKVHRIPPPSKCTEFRTDILTYPESGTMSWQQAWRHGAGDSLWTIDEHFRTKGGERSQRTVFRGLHFFDTLHELARFQSVRKAEGAAIGTYFYDNEDVIALPDFMKVAELTGQALDSRNMPHPTINGHILTVGEAFFDEEAYKVAKISQHRPLHPEHTQKKSDFENIMATLPALPQNAEEAIEASIVKVGKNVDNDNFYQQYKNKFIKLHNAAVALRDNIDNMIKNKFSAENHTARAFQGTFLTETWRERKIKFGKTDAIVFMLTAMPVWITCNTIWSTLTLGKGFEGNSPRLEHNAPSTNFRYKLSRFKNAVTKLPDGPIETKIKTMLFDFAKAAQSARHMEEAVRHKKKTHTCDNNKRSQRYMKKGIACIEKGAEALDLSAEDTKRLQLSFAKGSFPQTKYFLKELDQKLGDIEKTIGSIRRPYTDKLIEAPKAD